MSKRFLREFDEDVISSIRYLTVDKEISDKLEKSLGGSTVIDSFISDEFHKEKHINLPYKMTNPFINKKKLRLYTRYEYKSPTSASFLSSFHVFLEGLSFFVGSSEDNQNDYDLNIAKHLESVQIEALLDKKTGLTQNFNWDEKDYPQGVYSQCITFKIPTDKECQLKIKLKLKESVSFSSFRKVKISPALRNILPHIEENEGTEEEIFLGILNYISMMKLFKDSNRRYFNCDNSLRILFECESAPISKIRSLLSKYLTDPEPFEFELTLKTSITDDFIKNNLLNSCNVNTLSLYKKLGFKVIDFDIFDISPNTLEYFNIVNETVKKEMDNVYIRNNLLKKARLFSSQISEDSLILSELKSIKNNGNPSELMKFTSCPQPPLVKDLLNSNQSFVTLPSTLHSNSDFIDINSDNLFSSKNEWVDQVASKIISSDL